MNGAREVAEESRRALVASRDAAESQNNARRWDHLYACVLQRINILL